MLQAILTGRTSLQSTNDFRKYRSHAARKVAKLRKRSSLVQRPSKTQSPKPKQLSQPEQWPIALWLSERAWAAAREARSMLDATDQPKLHQRVVSKLAKATKYAEQTAQFSSDADAVSEMDKLELLVYLALVKGELASQQHNWDRLVSEYSQARTGLALLAEKRSQSAFSDCISSQIDPALRFALSQVSANRSVDIPRIAKRTTADSGSGLASLVKNIAPHAVDVDGVHPADALGPVEWRDHRATVQDADLAQAILSAQALDKGLGAAPSVEGSMQAFDKVLLSWQEAGNIVHELIVSKKAKDKSTTEADLQSLYIVSTYVSYNALWRRIQRDNMLALDIEKQGQDASASSLVSLRDTARLYENLVQSSEQMSELQGVFSDDELSQSINTMMGYFKSRRTAAQSLAYRLEFNYPAALALAQRAAETVGSLAPITVDLPVTQSDLEHWVAETQLEVVRDRGLATIAAEQKRPAFYVSDNLARYPVGTPEEVLSHLAPVKLELRAVAVKPVFYDIAFNYVSYPDEKQHFEQVEEEKVPEDADTPRRKGLFGIFKK